MRKLAGGPQNEIGHRVVIVGDGPRADAARFERYGTAARERIEHGGHFAPVRDAHQLAGDPEHFAAHLVGQFAAADLDRRAAGFPFHQRAVVEQAIGLRFGLTLPGIERQPFGRPLGDEHQESVAERVGLAVVGAIGVVVDVRLPAAAIRLEHIGHVALQVSLDGGAKVGRAIGVIGIIDERGEDDRARGGQRPSREPEVQRGDMPVT